MTETIIVRDRRTPHQFSIHNLLIDEWYPIIGPHGLALYSLYTRMAAKDDERSYPPVRMIKKHMNMGTSTVTDYSKLLQWCGLIHIEPGGSDKPNEYFILDVPRATPSRLAAIRQAINDERARKDAERTAEVKRLLNAGMTKEANKLKKRHHTKFLDLILRRLNNWQPISDHWKNGTRRIDVARPGQLSLFDDESGEGEGPQGGRAEVGLLNNILAWMGFDGDLPEVEQPSLDMLLAWALWVRLGNGKKANNPVGVARAKWRRGEWPAGGLREYAQDSINWLQKQENVTAGDLDMILKEYKRPSAPSIPEEYEGIIKR